MKYAPNRLSAGASPQTPLGELTALPQTPRAAASPSPLEVGPLTSKGEGWGKGSGREGRGKKRREGREKEGVRPLP